MDRERAAGPDAPVGRPLISVPTRSLGSGSSRRGPPEPTSPWNILDLQSTVGNRAVGEFVAGQSFQRAAGEPAVHPGARHTPASGPEAAGEPIPEHPLSSSQVAAAIGYTKRRFDVVSQMMIQQVVGAHADGDFGPETAQAVARRQIELKVEPIDGMVGTTTLDRIMSDNPVDFEAEDADVSEVNAALIRAKVSARYVHLVADLFELPISRALTVHLVESVAGAGSTTFESGGLPVVTLGLAAFSDSDTLRDAIITGLAAPPPEPDTPGERPDLLSRPQEAAAIAYDRARLPGSMPTRIVQDIVGTAPDGQWGPDTVERIAELQAAVELDLVDGKVGVRTMEAMHTRLLERGDLNALIRLVASFFELDEAGLLDMAADVELPMSGSGGIGGAITIPSRSGVRSPSIVRIRQSGLETLGSAAMVIAHELTHVRQGFTGVVLPTADREFEAHSEELLSPNLRDTRVVSNELFFSKADAVLERHFRDMAPDARLAVWPRFLEVRQLVDTRLDALRPEERTEYFEDVRTRYDAIEDPTDLPPRTLDED